MILRILDLGELLKSNKRMLCYHLISYSADGDVQWCGFKAGMAVMQCNFYKSSA